MSAKRSPGKTASKANKRAVAPVLGFLRKRFEEPLTKRSLYEEALRLYKREPFKYSECKTVPEAAADGMAFFLMAKYGQRHGLRPLDLPDAGRLLSIFKDFPSLLFGYRRRGRRTGIITAKDRYHCLQRTFSELDKIGEKKVLRIFSALHRGAMDAIEDAVENRELPKDLPYLSKADPTSLAHIIVYGTEYVSKTSKGLDTFKESYLNWKAKKSRTLWP